MTTKNVDVELLYLDLGACDRCQATDRNLDVALEAVSGVLRAAGREVTVRKTHVTTEEQAAQLGFVSSPTIRVNGRDIAARLEESACGACSSIAGTEVGCRTWGEETSAPVTTIVDAILRAVYGHADAAASEPAPVADSSVMQFLAAAHKPKACAGTCG
jgi:hypothetical protein